jgi:hypothetical protein
LSFVANLNDAALHKLLTTPRDSRSGLLDKAEEPEKLEPEEHGGVGHLPEVYHPVPAPVDLPGRVWLLEAV